ncbi:hypothetical protein BD626DRAFT_520397 [Schizophyllum amplum]|uniref:Uncharacterized protein n=1 Tax=Schizophyllum amplum TaxID=97359 RepID=A0A550BUI6_9AGAR|nr:hypothetical protein BD626DRAFT_520397 [Auriculariopsis ampla]
MENAQGQNAQPHLEPGKQVPCLSDLHTDPPVKLDIQAAATGPIRRLPMELLSKVFCHYVEDWVDGRTRVVIRMLSRVCTLWRATARNTPQLWTCVNLSSPPGLLDLQIILSGSLPLTIYHLMWESPYRLNRQLARLQAYAARWGGLTLAGSCGMLTDIHPADLSSLFWARIDLETYAYDTLKFLKAASNLRQLSILLEVDLYRTSTAMCTTFLGLPPLPCLTVLSLSLGEKCDLSVNAILQGLVQCAATLQQLEISVHENSKSLLSSPPPDDVTPILLPQLRRAILPHDTHTILEGIDCPALEEIKFYDVDYCLFDPFFTLYQLMDRSKPPLHTLVLDCVYGFDDNCFDTCLNKLDNLVILTIVEADDGHGWLHEESGVEFIEFMESGSLLPKLTTFNICSDTLDASDGAHVRLAEMTSARMKGSPCFTWMRLWRDDRHWIEHTKKHPEIVLTDGELEGRRRGWF